MSLVWIIICLLVAIVSFYLVLRWDVYSDVKKWHLFNTTGDSKYLVKHTKEAVLRAVLLIPTSILLFLPERSLIQIPIIIAMIIAWWWEFFDGLYNKKRGFTWRFTGSDDPDDAKSDDFLQKLTFKQQAMLKWGLIVIFTGLYILNLIN